MKELKVRAITISAVNAWSLLRHPLSADYDDIATEEMDELMDGLKRHGIVGNRRITLYQGKVLDGWQLFYACRRSGINWPPRFQELQGDDADAAAFVEIMNDRRRHEDPKIMMRRAQKRRERVVQLREQGKSERAIAVEVGASKTQVHRDLEEASGGPGGPPDGRVTGKDGKTYAATQPKLIPELASMGLSPKIIPELEALPRGKQLDFARLVKDGKPARAALKEVQDQREPGEEPQPTTNGRVASRTALQAFNIDKFEALDALVRQLEKRIDELVRLPGGEQLLRCTQAIGDEHKTVRRSEHLEALKRDLAGTRPHSLCPWCADDGAKGCSKCAGNGWVSKITWDGIEESVKERLK
jgi:hypothetical protein